MYLYKFPVRFLFVVCLNVTALVSHSLGQSTFNIKWGTHHAFDGNLTGPNYQTTDTGFSAAYTAALLKSLNADGTLGSALVDDVDLIEIGFFDTDLSDDSTSSSISPNTSTSNLFQGVWTPLSTKTVIAQNWNRGTLEDGVGGEFYFYSQFSDDSSGGEESEAAIDWKVVHNDLNSNSLSFDEVLDYASGTPANDNVVDDRVNALISASASNPVMLGIRFYDAGGNPSSGHGTTKYNTIMSTDWTLDWSTGAANLDLLEWTGSTVQVQDSLVFEFDNSDANTANLAKVGTGNTQISSNDFATTITYHDGASALDASTASHILSGLDGSGKITVGGDRTLTINANSGADRSFSGDIEGSTTDSNGATTLVKTGAGKQILTGDIRLAGTNAGWINVDEGTLSLTGASSKVFTAEYLTGSGGTLELNNTTINLIELGFANTSASQSFDGNFSMIGAGTEVVVKVASGSAAADYGKEQNITGVVSGAEKLVKDGVGRLVLKEDNTNTGGAKISDGTLVVGNDSDDADIGTGTIEIEKGKLEVLAGDSISNTVQATSANDKSMVGGDGTITSVTIGGDTTEITVVSPGQGISTSLTNETTTQQTSLGTGGSAALAMGDFTITNLTLNDGGVYDWEISDFSESGTAGTDYDVLKFNSLTFDSSGTFTLNILGLQADGTAGALAGSDGTHSAGLQNIWDDTWNGANKSGSYKGFKFLDGPNHGSITWGGVSVDGNGYVTNFFDIDQRGFSYHNDFYWGDWSVWYDGSGDFYLQFSAVPEPSTYIMVTGLLMVPGMSYVRRFRKKKDASDGDVN